MNAMATRQAKALAAGASFVVIAGVFLGCYGHGAYVQPGPDTPDTPLDQAGRGEVAYLGSCASCHGERGEGSEDRPALVGESALPLSPPKEAQTRKAEFQTAKDVFDYIKSDMPPVAPGSLSDEETYAVLAYILKDRRPAAASGDIGPANVASIKLHP